VLCNREIKFDSFVDEANKIGCDLVATGHYCRKDIIVKDVGTIYRLLSGIDSNKDQSYFLCQLSQDQLAAALFPIGEMTKPEVRKAAEELGLATATRKDSQGICFVGKVDLPAFLQQKLSPRKGDIVEIPSDYPVRKDESSFPEGNAAEAELKELVSAHDFSHAYGKTAGSHNGAHFFTIGQRKGMNIGGHKEPLFVLGIDIGNNIVYAGEGQGHPGLHRKGLFMKADEIHWIRPDLKMDEGESRDYQVRIRYRQPLQKARLYRRDAGMYVVFNELQRGIAAGQFAAWYDKDEVIGSGVIS
jgi:tRNA-specific 2-thiouridylase